MGYRCTEYIVGKNPKAKLCAAGWVLPSWRQGVIGLERHHREFRPTVIVNIYHVYFKHASCEFRVDAIAL